MNKNIKSYPQSLWQFAVIFIPFLISTNLIEKYTAIETLHWAFSLLLKLILIVFFAVLFDFKKQIRIQKYELIKGNYNPFFGFIKVEKQFAINSISEIVINQNTEKYFEIKIKTNEDEIIVDTLPNRNPALEELERIKKIVKIVKDTILTE